MRKLLLLLLSFIIISGCSTEESYQCYQCRRQTPEPELSRAHPDEFLCKYCADAADDLQSCLSCGNIFAPDSTHSFCIDCAEEHAATCCSCGALVDKQDLVRKEAEDGLYYYFCAPCVDSVILPRYDINYARFAEAADPQP